MNHRNIVNLDKWSQLSNPNPPFAQADRAVGVKGPLSPVNPLTGKTVSVMAVDCMLAGVESRAIRIRGRERGVSGAVPSVF